jgi:hypothetical protein
MSHDELEKYKALYSEYVSRMVDLHNDHQEFLNHTKQSTGIRVRAALKGMIVLNRELVKQTKLVHQEYQANLQEYRQQQALPKPHKKNGRPRKGEIRLPKFSRPRPGRPQNGESQFDVAMKTRDKKQ